MHPTIIIDSEPSTDCANPVGNCIEYCFEATEYITQFGAVGGALVAFSAQYPDGITIELGDYTFMTATPGGVDSFSWQGTPQQIAQNFADMLMANFEFGCAFTVDVFSNLVIITANDVGLLENWSFDWGVTAPPLTILCDGANVETRKNYRLIVEVWKCEDGELVEKLTTRAYEPKGGGNEICIDIRSAVCACVRSVLPPLSGGSGVAYDDQIKAEICLRIGEIWLEEDDKLCDAKPQIFAKTDPITIINACTQRDDEDAFDPYCFAIARLDTCFLTCRPDFAHLCPDSFAWFWYCVDEDLVNIPNVAIGTIYEFTYTDGSASTAVGDVVTSAGALIVPSGLAQIGALSNGKPIDCYNVYVGAASPLFPGITPVSKIIKIDVPCMSFCCCNEEFYFLNDLGGYDTILLNCLREIDFEFTASEFCGYEPCEGDILQGGKKQANIEGREIFRTTTQFTDEYETRKWLRQFLKSGDRYWRNDGKAYRVLFLSSEFALYRRDQKIYLTIEWVLSFDYKTLNN